MSEERYSQLKEEREERVAQGEETSMDRAIAEVEHFSELARNEAEYGEQQRWTGDGFEPIPGAECLQEVRIGLDCQIKHWGLWRPDGWWAANWEVFVTSSKAVAEAQCHKVNKGEMHNEYEVRCMEDWGAE